MVERMRRVRDRMIAEELDEKLQPVVYSGADLKESTYPVSSLRWIGGGFAAVLVLGALLMVLVAPGSASTRVGPPPRIKNAVGASSASSGSPATGAGGGGGGGGRAGASLEVGPAEASSSATPGGMRQATALERASVIAGAPASPGDTIDSVLIAESDPSWGVEYVDTGGEAEVVLVDDAPAWQAVEAGVAPVPCYPVAPADVRADLESVMLAC
jgi:hypothetical protein